MNFDSSNNPTLHSLRSEKKKRKKGVIFYYRHEKCKWGGKNDDNLFNKIFFLPVRLFIFIIILFILLYSVIFLNCYFRKLKNIIIVKEDLNDFNLFF